MAVRVEDWARLSSELSRPAVVSACMRLADFVDIESLDTSQVHVLADIVATLVSAAASAGVAAWLELEGRDAAGRGWFRRKEE